MKAQPALVLLLSVLLLAPALTQAQQWSDNLPQKTEPYTLHEYQKAFNDYWEPYNVSNGYYTDANGERQKAAGWKLFKRWEWYWQNRVDPRTGAFPDANRIDIYQAEKDRFPLPGSTRDANGNWYLDKENGHARIKGISNHKRGEWKDICYRRLDWPLGNWSLRFYCGRV